MVLGVTTQLEWEGERTTGRPRRWRRSAGIQLPVREVCRARPPDRSAQGKRGAARPLDWGEEARQLELGGQSSIAVVVGSAVIVGAGQRRAGA